MTTHTKLSTSQLNHDGLRLFLNKINKNYYLVPVRMRGLTSSGSAGKCYFNVASLVEIFGGKVVVGWVPQYSNKTRINESGQLINVASVHLTGHAVWMNDEGKMSDPTAKASINSIQTLPHLINRSVDSTMFIVNNKPNIGFIPLMELDESISYYVESIVIERLTNVDGGIVKEWTAYLVDDDGLKYELSPKKLKTPNSYKKFLSYVGDDGTLVAKEANRLVNQKMGTFGEKSVSTGKSLDEIRDIHMNRAITKSESIIKNITTPYQI